MKLKTIKEKQGDTNYTKFVFKALDLVKNKCHISKTATMFFFGCFHFGQVFFCNGKIYVANTKIDYSKNRELLVNTMVLTELHEIETNNYRIRKILGDKTLSTKTIIEQLIFEYNYNTAYWNIDEPINSKVEGEIEQLPFDLPIPNYTELLNNKW